MGDYLKVLGWYIYYITNHPKSCQKPETTIKINIPSKYFILGEFEEKNDETILKCFTNMSKKEVILHTQIAEINLD